MSWCKFFMPKIAQAHLRQHDAEVNEKIQYCKCVKGHVLKDVNDWTLCEHLPAPESLCWQEGGETIMSLRYKKQHPDQYTEIAEQTNPITTTSDTPPV